MGLSSDRWFSFGSGSSFMKYLSPSFFLLPTSMQTAKLAELHFFVSLSFILKMSVALGS